MEAVVLIFLILLKLVLAPFFTTSEEMEKDYVADRQQLESFVQVNFNNLAKETASDCGEYTDALYDVYTEAFYNELLTKEKFCLVIKDNHKFLFEENKYNVDFILALEHKINIKYDEW